MNTPVNFNPTEVHVHLDNDAHAHQDGDRIVINIARPPDQGQHVV